MIVIIKVTVVVMMMILPIWRMNPSPKFSSFPHSLRFAFRGPPSSRAECLAICARQPHTWSIQELVDFTSKPTVCYGKWTIDNRNRCFTYSVIFYSYVSVYQRVESLNYWYVKKITLLRVIPTMTFIDFLTGKSSGILSDISSGILSGISSGILSGKSDAFYLAYLLAFYLAFYLAYLLAYILTYLLAFYLAFYLAYLLA